MAATPQTLAEIQAKAQELAAKVSANPVTGADKTVIVQHAKDLLKLTQATLPHINTAQAAFGGQEEAINAATALTNKLNKVIAAYGG